MDLKTKKCYKCKKEKDVKMFGILKSSKDGLRNICKDCRKKYEYNPEQNKLRSRRFRKNSPDKARKNGEKYRHKNREKLNNKNLIYYYDNKEKCKDCRKKYYETNKVKVLKQCKNHRDSPVKFNSKSKYRKDIELYEEVKKSTEGYLECKCAYCGDWFTPTYTSLYTRLKSINNDNQGERRLYCSEACKQACPIYHQALYPKGFKSATSREVQPELRQMVLNRDNYTCQKCRKHKNELSEEGIALHCHHLEGIQWEPLMSADMDMCITYCQPCHVKAHQTTDCSYHDMKCK